MDNRLDTVNEVEQLKQENATILSELEDAYKNMEVILVQSQKEKDIAYRELQSKYSALQNTYTELAQKKNMLIHMEKLSSIGQFITEIVHELQNPLMVISAASELSLIHELPPKAKDHLEKIPVQVKKMSSMLQRFRAMAYKEKENFKSFEINNTLREFIATLELIKPKNIAINDDLYPESLKIEGDSSQITQIFLNLAKNAFDAMSSATGDSLKISTSVVKSNQIKKDECGCHCQDEDTWSDILTTTKKFVLISFEDNGPGIPEKILPFLFDSFFTTKEKGKGTGLGLAISTDIAKKHNGNICVISKPPRGTQFKIYIPFVENID